MRRLKIRRVDALVQCMFHSYSKPEGALVQTIQEIELNKSRNVLTDEREDNKHAITKIYGLCEFSSYLQVNK